MKTYNRMVSMKIIDDLSSILKYLSIAIIAGTIVLFVELSIISSFDNMSIEYMIRIVVLFVLYIISRFFKSNYLLILMLVYISMTVYVLLFSDTKDKELDDKNITIQSKSIFKTDEERKEFEKGTIKDKIIILKSLGLSKEQVYKKLENNTDFRTLIKNGVDKYYLIYDNSKEKNTDS